MSRETDAENSLQEYLAEKKSINDRRNLGLELRHKYEIYFVTLTFTLLGLAIQTNKKSSFLFANYVELLGWISLFISGLFGLMSLGKLWVREVGVAEVQNQEIHGTKSETQRTELVALENSVRTWGKARLRFFLFGVVGLMVSRGSSLIF